MRRFVPRLLGGLLAATTLACSRHPVKVAPAPAPAAEPAAAPEDLPPGVAEPREAALLLEKQLMVPVDGIDPARIPDSFVSSRGDHVHNALDILAPRGTPVLAADDGTILRLSTNSLGGITIYQLAAGGAFVYYYAHLSRYRDGLKEGMRVVQGDVIGYVGTTGNAPPNIPHLHFQLMRYRGDRQYWNGVPIDPWGFLVRPGRAR
jgi:murein DD-endopeptidase MepM/ murein hydrolase activator NlpD